MRRDTWLLFTTRCLRMFAFGMLSVVLVLFLKAEGLSERQVGLLLTMTLLGDTALSLMITTRADRLGRRRMLAVGAALLTVTGLTLAFVSSYAVLLIIATVCILSPSDKEVGPFLSIEQAALAQTIPGTARTSFFAWYHLAGSFATACGALFAGLSVNHLQHMGAIGAAAYRPIIIFYASAGLVMLGLFLTLSRRVEAVTTSDESTSRNWHGLHRSRGVVFKLSALFALDAFGGGFILQSLVADWFTTKYDINPALLGTIFFAANLLAAFSGLAAASLAKRFGLLNTMVFTHLPSNILLILVPLMPNLPLALGVFLARFAISQMDVPTRQSYTMAVVSPDERTAASGITTVARSVGSALAPLIAGLLMSQRGLSGVPFFIAGGVKIIYDACLYHAFKHQTH